MKERIICWFSCGAASAMASRLTVEGDKNVSKQRAQQLFPEITVTHAIADALLLAEYCKRTYP